MIQIDAIYRNGVFEPVGPVDLAENKRVRLRIEHVRDESPASWLQEVRKLQAKVIARRGVLPDSTPDIAEDRMR